MRFSQSQSFPLRKLFFRRPHISPTARPHACSCCEPPVREISHDQRNKQTHLVKPELQTLVKKKKQKKFFLKFKEGKSALVHKSTGRTG